MTTEMSQGDLDFIQSILSSGEDLYRGYERVLPYVSGDRHFWFEQASIINRQANEIVPDPLNNQSATFILAYTDFGLAVDGQTAVLQTTSNAIATNVLEDILLLGGVPPLDDMLRNDISAALEHPDHLGIHIAPEF